MKSSGVAEEGGRTGEEEELLAAKRQEIETEFQHHLEWHHYNAKEPYYLSLRSVASELIEHNQNKEVTFKRLITFRKAKQFQGEVFEETAGTGDEDDAPKILEEDEALTRYRQSLHERIQELESAMHSLELEMNSEEYLASMRQEKLNSLSHDINIRRFDCNELKFEFKKVTGEDVRVHRLSEEHTKANLKWTNYLKGFTRQTDNLLGDQSKVKETLEVFLRDLKEENSKLLNDICQDRLEFEVSSGQIERNLC